MLYIKVLKKILSSRWNPYFQTNFEKIEAGLRQEDAKSGLRWNLKGALIKTGNLLTIDNFPNSRFLIEFLPGISSKCHPVVIFPPAPF